MSGEALVGDKVTRYQGDKVKTLSMAIAKTFEELSVWQAARTQVASVYRLFSECRDWGYRDQLQRAAISVMNNVAEGYERRTRKDFAYFLDIAKASCGEVRSMLYVAEDLCYLSPEDAKSMRSEALRITKSLASLARSLRNNENALS